MVDFRRWIDSWRDNYRWGLTQKNTNSHSAGYPHVCIYFRDNWPSKRYRFYIQSIDNTIINYSSILLPSSFFISTSNSNTIIIIIINSFLSLSLYLSDSCNVVQLECPIVFRPRLWTLPRFAERRLPLQLLAYGPQRGEDRWLLCPHLLWHYYLL